MEQHGWWLFTTCFGIILVLISVLYKMGINKVDESLGMIRSDIEKKADSIEVEHLSDTLDSLVETVEKKADSRELVILSAHVDQFAADVKVSLASKIDAVECKMARAWEQDVSNRIERSIDKLKEENENQHKDIMMAINKRNGVIK